MIRINLLPFRAARKKENVRRQISIFILTFVLTFLGFGSYSISLSGKVKTLETNIEIKKTELAKFEKINKEINKIKKKLNIIQKKTKIIENLQLNRDEAVVLLETMTRLIIEDRMWLSNMSAASNSIILNGVAFDNKTVADFMTRLEKTKILKNIVLKSSKQTKILGKNLKQFSISCSRVPLNIALGKKVKK